MKKYILMLGWIVLSLVMGFGQGNFIQLNDASGQPASQVLLDSLNHYSNELVSTIDFEMPSPGSFKVFDVGFYLHERDYQGGFPEAFVRAINSASSQSPNYLVLGRQTDKDGVNIKLWVNFKFPEDDFACISPDIINVSLQEKANQYLGEGLSAYLAEQEILKSLNKTLFGGFCCSAYRASLNKGGKLIQNTCIDFEKIELAADFLRDNEEFVSVLDIVYEIFNLYKDCNQINEKPKVVIDNVGHGIVPYCFWKESNLIPYSPADASIGSGSADGFYNYGVNTKEFIESIPGGLASLMELTGKYIQYHTFCGVKKNNPDFNYLNPLEYYRVLAEKINEDPWTKPGLKAIFNVYMQDEDFTNWLFKAVDIPDEEECTILEGLKNQIHNTLRLVYDVLTKNYTQTFFKIIQFLEQEIDGIKDKVVGFDNESRYYQGYYGSQALIEILGLYVGGTVDLAAFIGQVGNKANSLKNSIRGGFNTIFRRLYFQRLKLKPEFKALDDDVKVLFESDYFKNDNFAKWILADEKRVGVWNKMSKHEKLRTNVDFMDNISSFSDDLINQLDVDLLNTKYTLKELFEESPEDVINIWKALKDDPDYHWELYSSDGFTNGSRWDKWSQREFFKNHTTKGKVFEIKLLEEMKTRSGNAYTALKGKVDDLDDRYLLSQVQFCRPGFNPPCNNQGEFFIADQVWIKYDADGDVLDMVIVDAKLSQGTNLTPGQNAAKNNIGNNLNYKTQKTIEEDDIGDVLPTPISQPTSIKNSAFYKMFSDGNNQFLDIE